MKSLEQKYYVKIAAKPATLIAIFYAKKLLFAAA